jgi:hypothetical protein
MKKSVSKKVVSDIFHKVSSLPLKDQTALLCHGKSSPHLFTVFHFSSLA